MRPEVDHLAASSDLPEALREALDQSRFLVLCASRQSAASRWVRQELDFWRAHKDPTHLLIVLTERLQRVEGWKDLRYYTPAIHKATQLLPPMYDLGDRVSSY